MKRHFATALIVGSILSLEVNADADQPEREALLRGAKAWMNNCARCHYLREPKEFRDDQWRVIVTHIRVRAGLTGEQARDITLFLQSSN